MLRTTFSGVVRAAMAAALIATSATVVGDCRARPMRTGLRGPRATSLRRSHPYHRVRS